MDELTVVFRPTAKELSVTGALMRSVLQMLDGDHTRSLAITLKDGAGRFVGELVSIESGTLTLVLEGLGSLLTHSVEQILSVELLSESWA